MTLDDFKKPSLDELIHSGVLGMHWGVRKTAGRPTVQVKTAGISVRSDGSMTIQSGRTVI